MSRICKILVNNFEITNDKAWLYQIQLQKFNKESSVSIQKFLVPLL